MGLRGATFLTHLEAQVTERQWKRTPGAKGNRAPGRKGRPHGGLGRGRGAPRCDFSHHLEAQVTERQWKRTPGAKGITHLEERDDKGYGEGKKI